ncbi:hypothetical protein GYA27_03830 [candidate division WWE3 bacterium]|uniref:Uncharacterized protein n=1 Tax=candidate division WWE3 bacterium TaxID=2053526 RepID=A0A7X9DKV4_UNCKA|nr:hypothetical protein [candidate division WWE3 bacterium]
MSEQLFSLQSIKNEPQRIKKSAGNLKSDKRAKIVIGSILALSIVALVWHSNREFEKKLTLFPNAKFVVEKTVFDRKEVINLNIFLGQRNPFTKTLLSLVNTKSVNADGENISPTFRLKDVKVTGQVIRTDTELPVAVPLAISQNGEERLSVQIDPGINGLKPGKHTLNLTIQRDNIIQTISQDFTWGVLAINPDKPAYTVNETGNIAFAVLDNGGNMVCDADLSLEITTPGGAIEVASTSNGLIKVSDTCYLKSFVEKEDFLLTYTFTDSGNYLLNLKAITFAGEFAINDSVQVTENADFDVQRITSTRIFPAVRYPVLIKITPNVNFKGSIHEKVPASFIITNTQFDSYKKYFASRGVEENININRGITSEMEIHNENTYKALQWEVDWKKGQTYYLYYEYDSPDESPNLFLLGPLRFLDMQAETKVKYAEPREWQIAVDGVTTTGWIFFGDNSAPSGLTRIRKFTAPTVWAAEFGTTTGTTANPKYITYTRAEIAPTREEITIGALKETGDLYIYTCTTGCDGTADYTLRWSNAGTDNKQDCNNNTPHVPGACTRPFDIVYEPLNGRAMVVYGDNVEDRVYYALWNGTGWSPNTTPGTPGATNQIDLPGSGRYPEWVTLKSAKPSLAKERSNNIMLLVADSSPNLYGYYWNGSSWDSGSTLNEANSLSNCGKGQCFDGSWWDSDSFVVAYPTVLEMNYKYRIFTISSGTWSPEQLAFDMAADAQWIRSAEDPTSTRVSFALANAGNDTMNVLFRGDNSTNSFTVCTGDLNCPDNAVEGVVGMQSAIAFERWGGDSMYLYNDAGAGNSTYYYSVSAPGNWGSRTLVGYSQADDSFRIDAYAHPNNDDIMTLTEDIDCDLNAKLWNGSAFEGQVTDLESLLSNWGDQACPSYSATAPANAPSGMAEVYDFTFSQYSPWTRNWRFYQDVTNTDPSAGLLNTGQNTAPFGVEPQTFMRLRINMAELSGITQTDTRKILQYTSGCNPNTTENTCTWTDVGDTGDTGAVWRYATTAETCAGCGDGATSSTSRLTGTNQATPVVVFVADKDAAADTDFDHTALSVAELDFPLYAQKAVTGITYYFRLYEPSLNRAGMDTPVYREQDDDGVGECAGGITCTYPSLTMIGGPVIPLEKVILEGGGGAGTNFTGIIFNN